ncbi:RNA-binding S4 domain-containing protein [Maricaulis sp. CAU 1757]
MDTDALRLDIWLWRCRFYKTRTLASAAVNQGRTRLTRDGATRRISKASALVRRGDALTLVVNRTIVRLQVLDLPVRRGPASEAQVCYDRMIEVSAQDAE